MGNIIVDLLLQYNLVDFFQSIFGSSKVIYNNSISQIPNAMALNFASALDLTTTFCFLLLQVTKFPQRKMQYPKVDLVLSIEPA